MAYFPVPAQPIELITLLLLMYAADTTDVELQQVRILEQFARADHTLSGKME